MTVAMAKAALLRRVGRAVSRNVAVGEGSSGMPGSGGAIIGVFDEMVFCCYEIQSRLVR